MFGRGNPQRGAIRWNFVNGCSGLVGERDADQVTGIVFQKKPAGVERGLDPATFVEHRRPGNGVKASGGRVANDQFTFFGKYDQLPIGRHEGAALDTLLLPLSFPAIGKVEANEIATV